MAQRSYMYSRDAMQCKILGNPSRVPALSLILSTYFDCPDISPDQKSPYDKTPDNTKAKLLKAIIDKKPFY